MYGAGVYGAGWHQAVTLCWLPLPAWADLSSSGVTIALHQTPIPAPESSGRMAVSATCDDSVAQLTDTRQLRNRMSGIRPSCDRVITQRRDYPHANGIRWTRYDNHHQQQSPPLPTGSSRPCPLTLSFHSAGQSAPTETGARHRSGESSRPSP